MLKHETQTDLSNFRFSAYQRFSISLAMKTIRFGLIGCGLMGREFASAAARWCHLLEATARPQIVAACSAHNTSLRWFQENVPSLTQATLDYRELLANPEVDAVYVAVPHHLHREIYCAAIEAGKHLMGEKPFGMDLDANRAILAAIEPLLPDDAADNA